MGTIHYITLTASQREGVGYYVICNLILVLCCIGMWKIIEGAIHEYYKYIRSNNPIPTISSKKYVVSLDGKHLYDCAFEPHATLFSIRYSIQEKAIWTREEIEEREYFEDPSNRNESEQKRYEYEQQILRLLPSENFFFILANGQPVPRNKESQWKLQYTMNNFCKYCWSENCRCNTIQEGFIRLSTPNNIHNFGSTKFSEITPSFVKYV